MSSSTAYYFYIPVWLKMKIFSVSNVRSVWLNLAIGLAPWNNKMLGTATVPNLVERLQERKPELTVGFLTQLWYQNGWKYMRKDQISVTCGGFCHWNNRLWLFLPSSWVRVRGIPILLSDLLSFTTRSCPWHSYSTTFVPNTQNRSDQKIPMRGQSTLCQFTWQKKLQTLQNAHFHPS